MPAKTISQLTQATTINGTDDFAIEQSGVTKRIAASVVRGDIANANISASAAIAHSKLAALNSGQILVGNGSNVPTAVDVTGDVTISNAGVTAIGSAKVLPAMLSGAQSGSAPIYGCRAWVSFDGTRNELDTGASTNGANVKIRANGNVTSVLKNGVGDYTVTFTTAMPDANYCVVFGCGFTQGTSGNQSMTVGSIREGTAPLAGSVRFTVNAANGSANVADTAHGTIAIIR